MERCPECGPQELLARPIRIYRHNVAALGRPVQVDQPYVCAKCGREVKTETSTGLPVRLSVGRERSDAREGKTERMLAMIHGKPTPKTLTAVQYPAVYVIDTQQVLPTDEGTIQDGGAVDRHGDPELMASFAEQYLSAYRALMPTGRLPMSVVEVMPALHLLIVAVELAMKADLMRSDNLVDGHKLGDLYDALDDDHRHEADDRFARCEPNEHLKSAGEASQTISGVLTMYDASYGGGSKVYLDTRYYAEPTTRLKTYPGETMLKAQTPYPIFLPHVVEALIETFRFFDGAARLARLGAKVALGARAAVENNHGAWGLVPASLGLVVVQVPQHARTDAQSNELPKFRRWRQARPPGLSTSWMYGGTELLFYRLGEGAPADSVTDIDGIQCTIWRDDSLGMHPRDLYRLADALDANLLSNKLRM